MIIPTVTNEEMLELQIEDLEAQNKALTDDVERLKKVAKAASKLMKFDEQTYIYDKRAGNLLNRHPDSVALLKTLYELNQKETKE